MGMHRSTIEKLQKAVKVQIHYTKAQQDVFFKCKARFRTIAKGRRLGFTKGASNYLLEQLLAGKKCLWVDTISANIQRYVERYFLQIIKQLPNDYVSWHRQDKKMLCKSGGFIDFRGADRPENIEGFAYDVVILNEAGIILKNPYLWKNAISPMLLDNNQSIAIIGGVPKGRNTFYELAENGMRGVKDWAHFQFSSYDNPLIDKKEIERLINELGGITSQYVRQEIFGEFLDDTDNSLFTRAEIESAMVGKRDDEKNGVIVWALDVARYGDDRSVLYKRNGYNVLQPEYFKKLNLHELSTEIFKRYQNDPQKPNMIFVDDVGVGAGVLDNLTAWGVNCRSANCAAKPNDERYLNKRAEMYFKLKEMMPKLFIEPYDTTKRELQTIKFFYNEKGKLQLMPKDDIKKEYGFSPDFADAIAMLFYDEVLPFNEIFSSCEGGYNW